MVLRGPGSRVFSGTEGPQRQKYLIGASDKKRYKKSDKKKEVFFSGAEGPEGHRGVSDKLRARLVRMQCAMADGQHLPGVPTANAAIGDALQSARRSVAIGEALRSMRRGVA